MKKAILALPLFLIACGISTLPTPAPVVTPHANAVLSAPVSITRRHVDMTHDGQARVIWIYPVTKEQK